MAIALGTRFYEESPDKLRLAESFIRNVAAQVDFIFVVINDTADKTGASTYLKNLQLPKTEVFSMNVWGKFTPALNAIVYNTAVRKISHLLLCSMEIALTPEVIQRLMDYMDDETLVVGAALAGHEFSAGEGKGTGASVPWNTLALWNVDYLARTGFLLVGDAPFDPAAAGVEELSTCAVLQALYPQLKIKLVEMPDVAWHIGEMSLGRVVQHVKKIKSKKERAQKQLEFLELKSPRVLHIPNS